MVYKILQIDPRCENQNIVYGATALCFLLFFTDALFYRISLIIVYAIILIYSGKQEKKRLFISPAFVFSLVVFLAFSIVPVLLWHGLAKPLYLLPDDTMVYGAPTVFEPHSYIGSLAERLILLFTNFLLAVHLLLSRWVESAAQPPTSESRSTTGLIYFCSALTFGMNALVVIGWVRDCDTVGLCVNSTTASIYVILQLVLILNVIIKPHPSSVFQIALLLYSIIFCIYIESSYINSKVAVFTLISLTTIFLYKKKYSWRRIFASSIAMGLLAVVVLLSFQHAPQYKNAPSNNVAKALNAAVYLLIHKVEYRQIEIGYCLAGVIDKHWDDPFNLREQFYWTKIFIPRVMWPDKPNFSLGNYYSEPYCRNKPSAYHSSAITLLGQPIIYGGKIGAAVGGTIILLFIGGLTFLCFRMGPPATVYIFATAPWWLDFEQDFALYFGNLGKLAVLVFIIAFASHIFRKSRYLKVT